MSRAERAEQMRALIESWESSGLTQRAFAEREGVAYSAFQYWRRRLRRESGARPRGERAAPVRLSPVRIVPDAPRPDGTARAFELRTASGLVIAVPPGFDEHELRRLLGALATC